MDHWLLCVQADLAPEQRDSNFLMYDLIVVFGQALVNSEERMGNSVVKAIE